MNILLQSYLIYPKVVGKSVGLSPIWTLLSITVGGSLFGVVNMIVRLSLASKLYALLKKDLSTRLDNIRQKSFFYYNKSYYFIDNHNGAC